MTIGDLVSESCVITTSASPALTPKLWLLPDPSSTACPSQPSGSWSRGPHTWLHAPAINASIMQPDAYEGQRRQGLLHRSGI